MSKGKETSYDYLLKYIIIGDGGVGKSNLLLRYTQGEFNPEYQMTIGVEFGIKNIDIKRKSYKIQIWDTAGQENYKSITRSYFKNSVCALVVYDISDKRTFENVDNWIQECKNQCYKEVYMTLVGNKSDLQKKDVSTEEGQELADKYGIKFYETSAKTGENVESVFNDSANEIAKKIEKGIYNLDDEQCGVSLGNKKSNNKKKKCC